MRGARDGSSFADEADSSWLSFVSRCLAPLAPCLTGPPHARRSKSPSSSSATVISWPLERTRSDQEDLLTRQDDEKSSMTLVYEQPDPRHHRAMTLSESGSESRRPSTKERQPRKSSASTRTAFSVGRLFHSSHGKPDTASRRLQISGPSDFRHVNSSTFQFPQLDDEYAYERPQPRAVRPPPRRSSFRPIQLSIYINKEEMSPLLPDFDLASLVPSPPRALLAGQPHDDHEIIHQRSYSTKSFHVPRKHQAQGSPSMSQEDAPPAIPPRARARPRAYTSPEVETLKERVASAMIEVEKLQRQIDNVVERQSIYVSSRPSTSHSMARTMPELEPMPSIPALPPSAPSFAERLNSEVERPQTAPLRSPVRIPNRYKTFDEASSAFAKSNPSLVGRGNRPPPPPLPLVLRPPLRKKKSFSHVSSWLFPDAEHKREISLDSVTNMPRPIKGTEGFYQCVAGADGIERRSFDTINTVSTWETDEEPRTAATACSPDTTTPITKQDEPPMGRRTTFGLASKDPAENISASETERREEAVAAA